ncbi:MAG: DUF2237 family protein [Pseudonocardia sp.]
MHEHTRSSSPASPGWHRGIAGCLCADRWAQAHAAGAAPPVVLDQLPGPPVPRRRR